MRNKTALITGASSGIGYEFAKILAKDSDVLVLVSRRRERLLEVKRELEDSAPVSVKIIVKDLSQPGAVEDIYRELESEKMSVDILINNAGVGHLGSFTETDWRHDADMIATNITALTHMTKLFVKDMIVRKKGRIMNVASTAAFQPGPLMAVYYASKAYVLSFSEAIANELRGTGVTITALCPGPTATNFAKVADMERSKLFMLKPPASASDVAHYGYDAMMKGKTVVVPGVVNKIIAFSVRLSPRKLLPLISRRLNEKN
jgi:uncharacterized protein